ncbi:hypothetical protein [Pseudomonas donghuensis]|uniref:Uncharacterized protein n=1 Tax=Pseudomonas donghuensis TaxID=1163398 RepID=A0AAP0SE72_9PSED|nr:hypothetical protein [Pseudomonas donghuensis]KDN98748.1 hypothetical protein BV82_3476 [Pseudomonas donghuensis]MCP6690976.1 hypothetical protein [Pseudomonas donghuensis]MDF9893038.1 hypothetical protein [Pseudomonas vranovensis]
MKQELWMEPDDCQTFCLAGPRGDNARALMGAGSRLVWEVEADSYFDAMSQYYAYMDWGEYRSDFPEQDKTSYKALGWCDQDQPCQREPA